MQDVLLRRLRDANPGWSEWNDLLALVESLKFQRVEQEYLGIFYAAGDRLCFAEIESDATFPDFVPDYVNALYGLKPDEFENSGGYAIELSDQEAQRGNLFSPLGNDAALGYPEFDPPAGTFPFQATNTGASVFLTADLDVVAPDANQEAFVTLDTLEAFTRRSIQAALDNHNWTRFYQTQMRDLMD